MKLTCCSWTNIHNQTSSKEKTQAYYFTNAWRSPKSRPEVCLPQLVLLVTPVIYNQNTKRIILTEFSCNVYTFRISESSSGGFF